MKKSDFSSSYYYYYFKLDVFYCFRIYNVSFEYNLIQNLQKYIRKSLTLYFRKNTQKWIAKSGKDI